MSFKKDDALTADTGAVGFFWQDKVSVFQEARVFSETPISPRKCRILLTKIIYLLYVGETFANQEATTLFFGVTKLFQHKDPALRQMVYLVIKELSGVAEDVIMVTSSIMKDMQPNLEAIYRPNAIRTLCRIIDGQMLQGLERFYKSAIVDRNSSISSSALVSAYQLFPVAKDVIKRWSNEANEAVNAKSSSGGLASAYGAGASYLSGFSSSSSAPSSPGFQHIQSTSYITQYHALGLLYAIRQSDRMAVTKMIQSLGQGSGSSSGRSAFGSSPATLRNPFAICMLIRYMAKIMEEDPNLHRQLFDVLDGYMRHKSDMVNYEAARTICELKNATPQELARPVGVLQLFLSSPKASLKFAAMRTLAKLAQTHPAIVSPANVEMERLINDENRSVATFAITTLLKTGNEASVDRLMKQISSFMAEISDDFKITVVNAIRALCLKFPSKQSTMLTFLSGVLRDEGGYDFKRAVVEAIFDMIKFISDSKESALAQLCEFIEDCEFTKLSVRILHLLGVEGPKAPQPSKYIRYIYNRVILENAIVRAAAVSSLAKFGVNVAESGVKSSIKVLLTRCLDDVDDEVRDRAAFYLKLIEDDPLAEHYVKDDATYTMAALEAKLASYVSNPAAASEPLDISTVPKISKEQARQDAIRARNQTNDLAETGPSPTQPAADGSVTPVTAVEDQQSVYSQQLAEIDEFKGYGAVLKSSKKAIELTERETEYVVTAVKHIFKEHIVFQFDVRNTLPDTVLEQVSVIMSPGEETELSEDFIMPVQRLATDASGSVYVSFTRASSEEMPLASFTNTLKFVSKEVDPSSGEPEEEGYEDEYQLEDLELGAADYIVPSYTTFATEWDRLRSSSALTETFSLSALGSLQEACDTLVDILGMEPLGGTETASSTSVHALNLSGIVCGGAGKVLARARMTYAAGQGVTLELSARAEQEVAAQLVMSAIA